MDLKQLAVEKGNPELPKQASGEHHALADARWNREVHAFLESLPASACPHPEAAQAKTGEVSVWCSLCGSVGWLNTMRTGDGSEREYAWTPPRPTR